MVILPVNDRRPHLHHQYAHFSTEFTIYYTVPQLDNNLEWSFNAGVVVECDLIALFEKKSVYPK